MRWRKPRGVDLARCRSGDIQTGQVRRSPGGQGSLWLRLPLAAAKKLTADGGFRVGWSRLKVDLLDVRSLRCYKCLERGHVRETCPNAVDRSGKCYRCGGARNLARHLARNCTATHAPFARTLGGLPTIYSEAHRAPHSAKKAGSPPERGHRANGGAKLRLFLRSSKGQREKDVCRGGGD